MSGKILVVGATGKVGSRLVKELIGKGETVRAATRDPLASGNRLHPSAEAVEFDFERPETFAPALNGVERVFLISRPGDEQADKYACPLIDEMKRQDVSRVVNLTAMGTEARCDFPLHKVEKYLEKSGLAFTHLRPNWFMQIFCSGPLLMGIRANAAIHIPAADAGISFIDARDVSSVAAATLTEPGHAGKAYTLTGNAALSHHEVARMISEASGKSIRYVAISEEETRSVLEASPLPPEGIERLLGFYRLVRQGKCETVSLDVETILARPPISFVDFCTANAACWT